MTNTIILNLTGITPRIHMIEHESGKKIFGTVKFNLKKYLGVLKDIEGKRRHYFISQEGKKLFCDDLMLRRIKERYKILKYNLKVFEK